MQAKDYNGAVNAYKRVVEIDPYSAEAHRLLGMALGFAGHRDGAIAEYDRAIDLRPDFADA